MEISEREYYELKEQVRQLQNKVDGIKDKPRGDLASAVRELPIDYIASEEAIPVFEYRKRASDTWQVFLRLAKLLHTPSPKFYMDRSHPGYGARPYIRQSGRMLPPKRISGLTEEQLNASVEMLNEMIPIYNKYFKETHSKVLYDPTGKGDYEWRGVVNEEEAFEDE